MCEREREREREREKVRGNEKMSCQNHAGQKKLSSVIGLIFKI